MGYIYLDHASTTYVQLEFIDKITKDLKDQWANPSNLYKISEGPKKIIEESRSTIARLIGAKPEEIFFTSGASEGNAWACTQKEKVVCSPYEHHNLTTNERAIVIDENWLDNVIMCLSEDSDNIFISKEHYSNYLCSWMMVNNETGEIFDIKKIAQKSHKAGMLFHSDMTQALGNVSINVKDLDVDIATFTGHKIHAPKGIGFIYFNSDRISKIQRLIFGGGQEWSFRAGTENVPYIEALRMAVYNAIVNKNSKQNYCLSLKKLMLEELNKLEVPYIINSPGNSVNNILNISIKDFSGEALMMELSDRNIYVGVGSACNSGLHEPSAVLTEMGVPEEYINGAIRFSFDFNTKKEDIISTAWNIADIIKQHNL